MSQKLNNTTQLKGVSFFKLEAYKAAALKRKPELEAIKAAGGEDWTQDLQDELNEIAIFLVDVDDYIAEAKSKTTSKAASYVPKKGTERLVHLRIGYGKRFSPTTGEEISKPIVKRFTYPEWKLFKENSASLGYSILEVLHDPYGEVAAFVSSQKN